MAGQRYGRRLQGGQLFPEGEYLIGPEPWLGEPGKETRKGGIIPAFCQPGAMGDLPITAKGFDQVAFTAIEVPEHLVALEQLTQLGEAAVSAGGLYLDPESGVRRSLTGGPR